jgi:hypothetical protein
MAPPLRTCIHGCFVLLKCPCESSVVGSAKAIKYLGSAHTQKVTILMCVAKLDHSAGLLSWLTLISRTKTYVCGLLS